MREARFPPQGVDLGPYVVSRAREGFTPAARRALVLLREALAEGRPLSQAIATYITDAIDAILAGEKADIALGLARRRGRPATPHGSWGEDPPADLSPEEMAVWMALHPNFRDRQVAALVASLLADNHKLSIAREIAARQFKVSEPTARRAWAKHGESAKTDLASQIRRDKRRTYLQKLLEQVGAKGGAVILRKEAVSRTETRGRLAAELGQVPSEEWQWARFGYERQVRDHWWDLGGRPVTVSVSVLKGAFLRAYRNERARVRRAQCRGKQTASSRK